jgi:hypothetical protein
MNLVTFTHSLAFIEISIEEACTSEKKEEVPLQPTDVGNFCNSLL